jgi:uncharacterized lipoprotein YmbA
MHRTPRILASSLAILLVTGCALRGDAARFYTLSTTSNAAPLGSHPLRVGLGPIAIPAYLNAPTIATRVDANRLEYARFDRWAGPLSLQVSRVLAQELAAEGTITVVPYPWYPSTNVDVVVRIDVLAFETDAGGTAHLDAVWSVMEPGGEAVRRSERTALVEPAAGHSREAAVAALSRTLAALAARIAQELPPARPATSRSHADEAADGLVARIRGNVREAGASTAVSGARACGENGERAAARAPCRR